MAIPKTFLDRFLDPTPALQVKYWNESDETPITIPVKHRIGSRPDREGSQYLEGLIDHRAVIELIEFYQTYNGCEICSAFDPRLDDARPLLELKPSQSLSSFTDRYSPGGDLAWTIDLNKSRNLYRGSDRWIAFGEVDGGPCCLTIFLEGNHAGHVFYLAPQPRFNILRPIAKSFNSFLERIAIDVARFLRLVRATVTIRGEDGSNYGFTPIEYLSDGRIIS